MHFDQFNAVQKENSISLPPTQFWALPHHANFLTKHFDKSIAFFKYRIVDQIHTYQILQTDIVWLRMLSWFFFEKLLASGIRCFI